MGCRLWRRRLRWCYEQGCWASARAMSVAMVAATMVFAIAGEPATVAARLLLEPIASVMVWARVWVLGLAFELARAWVLALMLMLALMPAQMRVWVRVPMHLATLVA